MKTPRFELTASFLSRETSNGTGIGETVEVSHSHE